MRLRDISWESVRMVSINDCTLRITVDAKVFTFHFDNADELSHALLLLSLSGSRKVELIDEARFNPARFLPGYRTAADPIPV